MAYTGPMGAIREFSAGVLSLFPNSSGATQTGIATPLNPSSHLEAVTFESLFPGLDPALLPMDRSRAMTIGAVAKGRNMICGAIGGMPLVGMRAAAPIPIERQSALIAQPERGRPRAITMAWTVDQMLWYGRAWWQVTDRYQDGRPMHVSLRLETELSHEPEHGRIVVNGVRYPESDFIRIDAMHEGLLAFGRDVLARAVAIEAAASRASDNPVPSIELHQTGGDPLTDSQVKGLVAAWAAARRGRNGGVAFTGPTVEVKTHGVAAEQLLIAGKNAAALDAARLLGLPAWAVDATVEGSSLTYSNVPSRSRELIDYTLQPYMDAIAGRLSMDDVLARGQWVRFDPRRLLSGDFADRMSAGKTAVDAGIYTTDEIRQMENEIPLEGA